MADKIKWTAGPPPPTAQLHWYHLTLPNGSTIRRMSDGVREWQGGEKYSRGRPLGWLRVTGHSKICIRSRYA